MVDRRTEVAARASIIASENFILATRETGYRDVVSAVAELIDNSLQANAGSIHVLVREDHTETGRSLTIAVLDDGNGMSGTALQRALQFGGSDRFGRRDGLGRFGMGLPNSSVSQARRFEVYSWREHGTVLRTYLDVDEVASGQLRRIPRPSKCTLPTWISDRSTRSGTLVVWTRCDRLKHWRAATIAERLRASLERIYRYPLWSGVRICVNDVGLVPTDPLFVSKRSRLHGASKYGPPLRYEFATIAGNSATVEVQFSELPVQEWHSLPAEQKRRQGISRGAGVSVVRAGREIDFGWFLMGAKRRENYDDWWRCEIRFSSELDELFGVNHSKQGIRPTKELESVLGPDLEAIARQLNSRVRAAFENTKTDMPSAASRTASARDRFLPTPRSTKPKRIGAGLAYRIEVAALNSPEFYKVDVRRGTAVVKVNSEHPFFTRIYGPIHTDQNSKERYHLECLLLAAARADIVASQSAHSELISALRLSWSDALATFLD